MDFRLGESHLMVQSLVRDFAAKEIAPHSAGWDERGEFPTAVIQRLGELRVTGLTFPEEYGGSGDILSFVIALEELAKVDSFVAATLEVVGLLCGQLLTHYGTEEQKRQWLPPLAQGKTIAAFALTEPNAGSDAAGITTKADLRDDQWTINGSKIFHHELGYADNGLRRSGSGPGP